MTDTLWNKVIVFSAVCSFAYLCAVMYLLENVWSAFSFWTLLGVYPIIGGILFWYICLSRKNEFGIWLGLLHILTPVFAWIFYSLFIFVL